MSYTANQIENYIKYVLKKDKKNVHCLITGKKLIFGRVVNRAKTSEKPNMHSATTQHLWDYYYNEDEFGQSTPKKIIVPVDGILISARANALIHWNANYLGRKAGVGGRSDDTPIFVLESTLEVLRMRLIGIAGEITSGKIPFDEGRITLEEGYKQIEFFDSLRHEISRLE